ncbi:MAG: hypothetical protein HY020_18935 [Burkholderiales bacterium]|nr:hypothetical protein [Burkholderiales bacterium]
MASLSADDLLLGDAATHTVEVPAGILRPGGDGAGTGGTVRLRPLRLIDLQRVHKAAGEGSQLAAVLMVQQALVEPALSIDQVNHLHAGLVQFLLAEVHRISGLTLSGDELSAAVQAPLARACFTLSREFGWTPEQCAGLSVGQVLLYLEMLARDRATAIAQARARPAGAP